MEVDGRQITPPPLPLRKKTWVKNICAIILGVSLVIIGFYQVRNAIRSEPAPVEHTILHSPVVEVPLKMVDGWPFVEVTINGQGPFQFLLDTGAYGVTISRRLSQQLGLSATGERISGPDAAGITKTVSCVQIETMRLGGAAFKQFEAASVELEHLRSATNKDMEGILGVWLFRELLLTIDFPQQRVIVKKGSLDKMNDKDVLPVTMPRGTPIITAQIGDDEMELLIDTGSNGFIMLPASIAKTRSLNSHPVEGESRTYAGIHSMMTAQLNGKIHIGRHVISNPMINWFVEYEGRGIVGMKILKYFALTFDAANQTVSLKAENNKSITLSVDYTDCGHDHFKATTKVRTPNATESSNPIPASQPSEAPG